MSVQSILSPEDQPAPTQPSLRERRRAETLTQIKRAALTQLAQDGPEGLSLRAVAREVGVSVQALYHYFDSRDALVTSLVTDSYLQLAEAVREGVEQAGSGDGFDGHRALAAGLAYRRWALNHQSAFLLIFGTPLPGYAAPEDGPTTEAADRLGEVFLDVIFAGWSEQERAVAQLGDGMDALTEELGRYGALRCSLSGPNDLYGLGPVVSALFTTAWAVLHGMVMLELLGHLPWVGANGEDMCRHALLQLWDTVERIHADARQQVSG